MIRVQQDDFDMGAELKRLTGGCTDMGAVASFLGLVRNDDGSLKALSLEHYPGMTEHALLALEAEAHRRWPVADITIIHHFGRLAPGEQIVLVAVLASPRLSEIRLAVRSSLEAKATRTWQLSRIELLGP